MGMFTWENIMEALTLNTKAQRNLTEKSLEHKYTDKELEALRLVEDKSKYITDARDLGAVQYGERFEEQKLQASEEQPPRQRKWSPEEDAFLTASYMYISDNTIALALNIPSKSIKARRKMLGLTKTLTRDLDLLIWCRRDDFEKDVKELHLTKARPDI